MEFSSGSVLLSLLTLIISIVILIIYRQIDRNSRTLDSLRRYSERKCKELDSLVSEKKMELEDIKLGMEEGERNAKALIEKFNLNFDMVKSRDEELLAMNRQIDACRISFNEMADASQRADKNLKLLNQESRRMDGVRNDIRELFQKLDGYKAASDSLVREIGSKNADEFENLRVKVLNDVNLKLSELESGIERAEGRLKTFNEQVGELTGRQQLVADKAVSDLESVVAKHLDSFKGEIENFGKNYMERLGLLEGKSSAVETELFAQLDKESRSRLDAVRESISKEFDSYRDSVSQRLSEVDSIKQNVAEIGATLGQIDEKVASAKAAVEGVGNLDAKLAAADERIAKIDKVMEWLAKTETRLNDAVKKGEDAIAAFGNLMAGSEDPSASGGGTDGRTEMIKHLIQRGWSDETIAEKLNISEGEVEFIREFN